MASTLIISTAVELLRLRPEEIISIEADGNYSTIHLTGGCDRIVLVQLGAMEGLISQQLGSLAGQFIRIGRGVIINSEYVFHINMSKKELIMRDHNNHNYPPLKPSVEALRALKDYFERKLEREDESL